MIQRGTVIAVGLLLGMCGAPTTYAEEPVVATPVGGSMDQREIHKLELTLGKSRYWTCLRQSSGPPWRTRR